jgi:hypothetical protein
MQVERCTACKNICCINIFGCRNGADGSPWKMGMRHSSILDIPLDLRARGFALGKPESVKLQYS